MDEKNKHGSPDRSRESESSGQHRQQGQHGSGSGNKPHEGERGGQSHKQDDKSKSRSTQDR